jgi:hypothetical protein
MKKILISSLVVMILAGTFPAQTAFAAPACSLTAAAGEIIVSFPDTAIFGDKAPRRVNKAAAVPAGAYTISAVTWDNHNNGDGETKERVRFIFKDGSGEIVQTGATTDIAGGQNSRTTDLGTRNLTRAATLVTAEHAFTGTNKPEDVTPICIKLTPVTTTPATLAVTCAVPTTAQTGQNVTWDANPTGGNGTYTYSWTGADIAGATTEQVVRSYSTTGSRTATVTVTSGAQTASASCSTNITASNNNDDDFEVQCRVSDTTIDEGDTVTYSVDIDNGDSPYDIEWDGDIEGDDMTERVRFNRDGRYEVDVTVRDDDGNRATDNCPIVRVSDDNDNDDDDDDDDNRNVNVITRTNNTLGNTPTGNLTNLSSVYLSQVPYTGPAEVLAALGVLGFIAIWSTGAALYFKRRRALKATSNKIAAFKEANKIARV